MVLSSVQGAAGFPRLLHHQRTGERQPHEMLVMTLLGPSLQRLWESRTSRGIGASARPTVLQVGREVLRCLRRLHEKGGYVHNDLKPGNVVLGAAGSRDAARLHLIDFGLSTPLTPRPGAAMETSGMAASAPAAGRAGTPTYASIAAHEERRTCAADDLESLVYMLADLAAGRLPWQAEQQGRSAVQMKRTMVSERSIEALFEGAAAESPSEGREDVASSLQAVWALVVACHETGAAVDYDACLNALGGGAEEDDQASLESVFGGSQRASDI